jgi:hypothetical protein
MLAGEERCIILESIVQELRDMENLVYDHERAFLIEAIERLLEVYGCTFNSNA